MLAGTFEVGEPERAAVDGSCFVCGGALTAIHARGQLTVACEREHVMLTNQFPAGGATGRPLEAVTAVVDRITGHETALAREGACPNCYGSVETWIEPGEAVPHRYRARCRRCGYHLQGTFCRDLPAVVAFYRVDVAGTPHWELGLVRAEPAVLDDGRYRIATTEDGEELVVVLDGDGEVCDVRRR